MAQSLVYYPDDRPGVSRRRCGSGFAFYAADGTHIADKSEVARLKALAVPPAYEDVWMAPISNAHLLATGRDAKERKQYRYHPDWRAQREARKFDGLADFGERLPALRRWIANRLSGELGDLETALAATLALIDRGSLRVGSPVYTRNNKSHGATTLKPRHVSFDGDAIRLDYVSKGGKKVSKKVLGPALQRAVQRFQDLPGPTLISWTDDAGDVRAVQSEHLQEVIRDICGPEATAKTIRTWNGTHAAFGVALARPKRLTIASMAEAAAERLHNTPAIARNSYIHPDVIALTEMTDGDRTAKLKSLRAPATDGLRQGEGDLIAFLNSAHSAP